MWGKSPTVPRWAIRLFGSDREQRLNRFAREFVGSVWCGFGLHPLVRSFCSMPIVAVLSCQQVPFECRDDLPATTHSAGQFYVDDVVLQSVDWRLQQLRHSCLLQRGRQHSCQPSASNRLRTREPDDRPERSLSRTAPEITQRSPRETASLTTNACSSRYRDCTKGRYERRPRRAFALGVRPST